MNITFPIIVFRFLLVFYKLLLDYSYEFFIHPEFGYSGFDLSGDTGRFLQSWLIYLFLASLIRDRIERPSDFLIFLLFVTTIAPMLSLFGLSDRDITFTYATTLVFLIIIFFQCGPYIKIPHIKHGVSLMIFLSLAVIFISLVKMASSGALFRINFDLSKVYSLREVVGDTLFDGIWGYVISWMTKIFTIILIAYGLLKKKYSVVLILVVFQVILFGITTHKSIALYPVFPIGLYIFKNSKHLLTLSLLALIFLIIGSLFTYFEYDNLIISSLLIRRTFFVPALLKYYYHDYFSVHGFVYWSNSVLSSIIDYPFSLPPVNLIGSTYFGQPDQSANTGFIGTSYMNFGFPGMIVVGVVVAILIKLTDAFANGGNPNWFYLSFLSIPFFGLFTNAAVFTTLLTHGLGVALFMAWLSYNRGSAHKYN